MRLCQIFSRHIDIQNFEINYLTSIWFYLFICIPWTHTLNTNNLNASHWKKLKQILIIMAKLLQKRFKQITLKSFISKQKKVFLICSVLLKKIDVAFICGSQFLFESVLRMSWKKNYHYYYFNFCFGVRRESCLYCNTLPWCWSPNAHLVSKSRYKFTGMNQIPTLEMIIGVINVHSSTFPYFFKTSHLFTTRGLWAVIKRNFISFRRSLTFLTAL